MNTPSTGRSLPHTTATILLSNAFGCERQKFSTAPRDLQPIGRDLRPSSPIQEEAATPVRMNKIREALSIQFDAIEPTADGYRVSNSSNPDRKSVWLSQEEWRQLCRLVGWMSDSADHGVQMNKQ